MAFVKAWFKVLRMSVGVPLGATNPIHKPQADTPDSASPARRMPHAPSPRVCRRNHSQGPAHRLTLLPKANKAMVMAPSSGELVSAATISAEYKRPQGMNAHNKPTIQGADRAC